MILYAIKARQEMVLRETQQLLYLHTNALLLDTHRIAWVPRPLRWCVGNKRPTSVGGVTPAIHNLSILFFCFNMQQVPSFVCYITLAKLVIFVKVGGSANEWRVPQSTGYTRVLNYCINFIIIYVYYLHKSDFVYYFFIQSNFMLTISYIFTLLILHSSFSLILKYHLFIHIHNVNCTKSTGISIKINNILEKTKLQLAE